MKRLSTYFTLLSVVVVLGCTCCRSAEITSKAVPANTASLREFTLRDFIGHEFRNEVVTYAVSDNLYGRTDVVLFGPTGKRVPLQWTIDDGGKKSIAFLADVPRFGVATYRLVAGTPTPDNDLKIEEDADSLRLENSETGVSLRKKLAAGEAPLNGVRLRSGRWVGASRLQSLLNVVGYTATVTARGPVFEEALCDTHFAGGQYWRMRFRLVAGEPVVKVDETYDADAASSWTFDLNQNFNATNVLYRLGRSSDAGHLGKISFWKIAADAEPAFVLEPWLRWWMRDRQGSWFGLYNDTDPDLLAMQAVHPAVWVDPDKKNDDNREVLVQQDGGTLGAKLPLRNGRREWLLTALNKADSLPALQLPDMQQAPEPQQYLIKYGDFPLDSVKDYVLDWKSDDSGRPRLLVTPAELTNWKKNFNPDAALLGRYLKTPLSVYNVAGPLQYYLATGDEKLGRLLSDFVTSQVQEYTDGFVAQKWPPALGVAPHEIRAIQAVINTADAIWSTALTAPERDRLKAQLAFMAYTVARPDYWSPERGYAANPNMTSMVAGYQAQIGMMLKDHPLSATWSRSGMTELKSELADWSDSEGGWLEAPAYAIASWDFILGMFVQAHNTGADTNALYDPKMKKVADWMAMISTPPDAHVGGIRHLPPIGNTYIAEPTGEFGIMAYLWKAKDPAFSARMQWMQAQQGNFVEAGIGGFSPSLEGYRELLMDASLPTKMPDYHSILFPKTGVSLRNGVDDRETQLLMIAGDNHAHYDKDSGSITLWGKGRIVADDFGYEGYMPGDDHSMLVSAEATDDAIMQVNRFAPSPDFDYARGQKNGWQRQIAFVKDIDPMAPNYFVLRDTLSVPAPAAWRLWLTANAVTPKTGGALAVGKEDVDTDIDFLSPSDLKFTTENKTRETYGLDANRKYGKVSVTQTGIVVALSNDKSLTTLIYPRLKTQPPPVVTALADGKVVKVVEQTETDYVFLSDEPFAFRQDDIDFQGSAGLLRIRDGKATLSLGAAGHLSALGQSKDVADTTAVGSGPTANLIPNGDFEAGRQDLFLPDTALIHAGDPSPGGQHSGRYCLALTLPAEGRGSCSIKMPLFVDKTKLYRISADVYTPDAITTMLTGYASDGKNSNLKGADGKVWGYDADIKGPLTGWQKLEATVGPAGSGAKYIFPPETLQLTMTLRYQGGKGTVYVDNVSLETVK